MEIHPVQAALVHTDRRTNGETTRPMDART